YFFCLTRYDVIITYISPLLSQVTIGRGLNVTHQLVSPSCLLMISRLHCMLKQRDDGRWTVTDKKVHLNGVWVNGERIPVDKALLLRLGDSIKLKVTLVGTEVEHEYILIRQRLEDIKPYLAKGPSEVACTASRTKKSKRKLNSDEMEPSTSFKSKPYALPQTSHRASPVLQTSPGRDQGTGGGRAQQHQRLDSPSEGPSIPIRNLSHLQTYKMLVLRERMNDTQHRARDLQSQLELLWGQLHRMELLERSISEMEKLLWTEQKYKHDKCKKTQHEEIGLKKLLEEALQEQRKVIEEIALSRQGFEDILKAKDKELFQANEEVVKQMTEVLENEQCIICSELFIRTVNCAHSFCLHCIREWRKRKDECPICWKAILSQSRSHVLVNCIDRMVEQFIPDMKQRRLVLITEKKGERYVHPAPRFAEVVKIH
uniref:E3 ubiquitin-protein ligase CHFR n=1 Tax=Oncorhynchus kisutch TaxID=8019 RepID=A0A8C7MQJ7_ONCKI